MTTNGEQKPRVWLVRGSKDVRFNHWMLDSGVTGIEFKEITDLGQAPNIEAMRSLVARQMPDKSEASTNQYAAQLNAFANKISIGDIVALPLTNEGQIAFGKVTGEYRFLPESDGLRHVRNVDWVRKDVPRTAIKQDLLYSLGAFSTVCEIRRNDASYRLSQITDGAETDPGSHPNSPLAIPQEDADVVDSDEAIATNGQDIIQYSRDRIAARIIEHYSGHGLQDLVAEILRAEGMTCKVQPKGADGGIDIIAGSGVLGISAPTIIVQVKSQSTSVGSEVLDQLGGVVGQHQADHGLLVALAGLTNSAKEKVKAQRLKVAVWDADELIDRLMEHYEVMSDEVKLAIPLRKTWLIDEMASN